MDPEALAQIVEGILGKLTPELEAKIEASTKAAAELQMQSLGLEEVKRKLGFIQDVPDYSQLGVSERLQKFFRAAFAHDEVTIRALSGDVDAAGGYAVPTELIPELVKREPELSELFAFVRVIPAKSNAGQIPRLLTDVSVTHGLAENADWATGATSEPALDQPTYSVAQTSIFASESRQVIDDAAIDITGLVRELFVDAMNAERDKMIAIGSGSSQPLGIYSATITQSVAVGGSITFAKLVAIEHALPKKYRKRARWVFNNTQHQRVMSLTDSNNQPIFKRSPEAGHSPTLLGYSISQQDDLPDHWIGFGDLMRYWWFDREQLGIETTTVGGDAFKKHQMLIKAWERNDGKVMLPAAFSIGTGITA